MSDWECWLFSDKKQEWTLWTKGSLEEVLDDYADWSRGEYRGYSAIRLERRKT